MKVKACVLFIMSFLICNLSIAASDEYFRDYWDPVYHLLRMDYCTFDGQKCGTQLAHEYCRAHGYSHALDSKIAHNIPVTNFFNTKLQCKGSCQGFAFIRCVGCINHKPPEPYRYRYKKFIEPCYASERVDWCFQKNVSCGERAANSFCRRMGYMKSSEYEKSGHLPRTKYIGSTEVCFGPDCLGFKAITCYR